LSPCSFAAKSQFLRESKLNSIGDIMVTMSGNSTSENAKEMLRRADAVCFDVDSTVVVDEGIDILADVCGCGKEVADWCVDNCCFICEIAIVQHGLGAFVRIMFVVSKMDVRMLQGTGPNVIKSMVAITWHVATTNRTNRAMGGNVLFQDALSARLDIMKPSLSDIENCLQMHPPQLTPGVKYASDVLFL
jgi:hypothetical protein